MRERTEDVGGRFFRPGSGAAVTRAPRAGIYLFPEFSPEALAAYSGREFDAAKDRTLFLESLGLNPTRFSELEQVHGNQVVVARGPFSGVEADGLVTQERNLALLVKTADCAPILFLDPERPAVGIAHAGWRGLREKIVTRLVETLESKFRSRRRSLKVAIGPAICRNCYEVGPEFENYFPGWIRHEGRRRFLDLVGKVKEELAQAGIVTASIQDSGQCTACSVDRFFSARREGEDTGRLISLVVLK